MMRCPTCKRDVDESQENKRFPFCSDRCKLIDLGRWLNGKYQISVDESAREAMDDQPIIRDDRD